VSKRFLMQKTRNSAKPVSADEIARLADQGRDVAGFFRAKADLNVSRQAVIKTLVRQAPDQHYLAEQARRSGCVAKSRFPL
jgi:hypothetical protein